MTSSDHIALSAQQTHPPCRAGAYACSAVSHGSARVVSFHACTQVDAHARWAAAAHKRMCKGGGPAALLVSQRANSVSAHQQCVVCPSCHTGGRPRAPSGCSTQEGAQGGCAAALPWPGRAGAAAAARGGAAAAAAAAGAAAAAAAAAGTRLPAPPGAAAPLPAARRARGAGDSDRRDERPAFRAAPRLLLLQL